MAPVHGRIGRVHYVQELGQWIDCQMRWTTATSKQGSHTFEFAWHRCTRLSPVSAMISFPSISKTKHLGTDNSEGEFTFPSANINVIVNIHILATITTNRRKPVIGGLQRNILASIDIHVTTSTSRPLRDSMLHLQTQVEHGVSVRQREMPPTILVHEADKLGKLKH